MKKYLFVLLLSMFSINAMACEIRGGGLPDEMVQKLKVECEQMKLAAVSTPKLPDLPAVTREDVSEWAKISQEFAKAIGIAAREVGVTVNEFMMTPAGVLTCVVLAWVIFGKTIMAVLLGLLLSTIVVWFNKRLWFSHTDTVTTESRIFGTSTKDIPRYLQWKDMQESGAFVSFLSVVALGVYWTVVVVVV